jgi:muramoyltetrapeptide carboxypeptidase
LDYYCQMTIIPPYLKKGDTIGIMCPAGFMPAEKAETCIKVLQEWGYKVKVGKTLGNQYHYFSATDQERLDELQEMLDDDNIKAILFGRGGYGVGRIIDKISFKKFRKNPKWLIGYSDITILHAHLFSKYKIASLHSPMAAAFNDEEYKSEFIQSLQKTLKGQKQKYSCAPHAYNKSGKANGILVGGNLSLLAHVIGTSSDINTAGKILFIEDVGEYIYNIDRMLYQLKRSGKFEKLSGLIVGSFSDMKDTTVPLGQEVYAVINEIVKEYGFPVCFQFPVGHTRENFPLKVGVEYQLKIGNQKVSLSEV